MQRIGLYDLRVMAAGADEWECVWRDAGHPCPQPVNLPHAHPPGESLLDRSGFTHSPVSDLLHLLNCPYQILERCLTWCRWASCGHALVLNLCCACLQICAFAYYSAPLYYITEKALRVHHKPFYIRVPCRYPVGEHRLSPHPCRLSSVTYLRISHISRSWDFIMIIWSTDGHNTWVTACRVSESLPAHAAPAPPERAWLVHSSLACTLGMAGCMLLQHSCCVTPSALLMSCTVTLLALHKTCCTSSCLACRSGGLQY